MIRHTTLCPAAVGCLLAGCNQPAVTLKAPAFQSSENTVHDWNDVAHTIASEMALRSLVPSDWQPATADAPQPKRVFVRVQAPDSAFVREVANELESDILRRGGTIARIPAGATVVNLDVNFVKWGPRDKPPGLLGTTAAILAIPAIVIGASAPMSTWTAADAAAFTAIGVGVVADAAIALTPTMNAEAVWEATIVTNDQVVMKVQEPIYIRAHDIPLYAKATNLSPLSSWSSNAPLRARTIRFDP
jgi:hypothetical protein